MLKGNFLFIERDLAMFFIPPKFFWVESIKNGEFPLWNPYNLFGQPFFATLQPAILYPPNIMFLIFPFSIAFNWSIILHIFLGGAFVYALLRDMDANEWASFTGALTFMLGGYLLSVHNLLSILISVIWTPLIMLFFRRAIKDGSFKNVSLTGLFLSISFLGGNAEAVFGCLIALFLIAVFSKSIGGRGSLKAFSSLVIATFIFLGLSAIQLVPFLELSSHSIRSAGLSYLEATIWSLAPWDIISFFITDPYGYYQSTERYWANQSWLKTLYTGFLPFLLMAFFFVKGKRDRLLWLGIIAISFFFALGGYNPFYYYIYSYVPFFNKLRYPVKFLYLAILALSVTAGLGMHMLMEKDRDKKKKYFINAVFAIALVSVFFLVLLNLGHNHIESFLKAKGIDDPVYNIPAVNLYNAKRALFYLALFGVILKIGYGKGWGNVTTAFLSIALIGDIFGNLGYYHRKETKEYFKPSWAIEKMISDKDWFRIIITPKTSGQTTFVAPDIKPFDAYKQLIHPSINLIHKIYDVRGAEVIRIKKIEDIYNVFAASPAIDATNLASLFGIKYIISLFPIDSKEFKLFAAHTEGLEEDYDELIEDKTIKIYKNLKFMPRVFLAENFKVLEKDEETLSAMISKDFKPDRTVFLKEKPLWDNKGIEEDKSPHPPFAKGGIGRLLGEKIRKEVKIVDNKNNRIKLIAETSKKALLVLTDTYYPGWKVFVNGKEEKIYLADYAFRAVPLTAGKHEVEFVYDPLSFKLGLAVSLFTLIAISAVGLVFIFRRKKICGHEIVAHADSLN
jgi:hypothetical protein